ncbi:DUF6249 domain-containing protein [Hyphobacterium sp.]|uniref:DUF6249 domain-containing protein n=1 Tax=Hyphobacterium sp. TaxID=2004662 RepID=UPI00374787A1
MEGFMVLIPLSAILLPAIIVGIVLHFGNKNKREILETVRVASQNGTILTPEVVKSLGVQERKKGSELRTGMIWTAVAAAVLVFGWAVGPEEDMAFRVFAGIAAFPGFIGLTLIAIGVLMGDKSDDAE